MDINQLREPYVKADQSRTDKPGTQEGGTGIGLSIVKRVAALHGFEATGRKEGDKITFGIRMR